MSSAPRVRRFADGEGLAGAVAGAVRRAVEHGIAKRARASLVLSGGSTPEAFLPAVARLTLPWEQVSVYPTDERRVPEDSADANAAMLRRVLLSAPGPSRARYVSFSGGAPIADRAALAIRSSLPPASEPYDLVILGMGNDGHIASLFPGSPRLAELLSPRNGERLAAVPAPTTATPAVERITMTLAELRRAERVLLVIRGTRKLEVLEAACARGDSLAAPVAALEDVEAFWAP